MSPLFSNFGYVVQFTGFLVLYIVEPPIKFVPNCISTELVRHTKTKPCNATWAELIAILTVCDLSSVCYCVTLNNSWFVWSWSSINSQSLIRNPSMSDVCNLRVPPWSMSKLLKKKKTRSIWQIQNRELNYHLYIDCVSNVKNNLWHNNTSIYVYTFGNYKFWWRSRESSEVTDEVVTLLCPTLCGSCT